MAGVVLTVMNYRAANSKSLKSWDFERTRFNASMLLSSDAFI